MATLLETELIRCLAVEMTLLAVFLGRVLTGARVSEKYNRQQHEGRQQQSSVSFLRHISLRKVNVGVEAMVQTKRVNQYAEVLNLSIRTKPEL